MQRCRFRCRLIPSESDFNYYSKEHVVRKSYISWGFDDKMSSSDVTFARSPGARLEPLGHLSRMLQQAET